MSKNSSETPFKIEDCIEYEKELFVIEKIAPQKHNQPSILTCLSLSDSSVEKKRYIPLEPGLDIRRISLSANEIIQKYPGTNLTNLNNVRHNSEYLLGSGVECQGEKWKIIRSKVVGTNNDFLVEVEGISPNVLKERRIFESSDPTFKLFDAATVQKEEQKNEEKYLKTVAQCAPGVRIEVRDAEWVIQRIGQASENLGLSIECEGISRLVRGKRAVFLSRLEKTLRVLDPKKNDA